MAGLEGQGKASQGQSTGLESGSHSRMTPSNGKSKARDMTSERARWYDSREIAAPPPMVVCCTKAQRGLRLAPLFSHLKGKQMQQETQQTICKYGGNNQSDGEHKCSIVLASYSLPLAPRAHERLVEVGHLCSCARGNDSLPGNALAGRENDSHLGTPTANELR